MQILFTCYPGLGHLHPMLPLARAALRAGHEVRMATGPDVAPRSQAYGFETWSVGLSSDDIAARYLERFPHSNELPAPERLRLVAPNLFGDIAVRSRLQETLERTEAWPPDLIVHDQSELSAPIVAAARGTPTVVHSWGPMMPKDLLDLIEPAVERVAADHGIPLTLASVTAETPYVDICPPSLQLPGGPEWRRIQPVRHEDAEPGPDDRLPEAVERLPYDETVYVTLGTVVNTLPGVFEAILEGVRDVGRNVIVTVGPDVDPERLGPQPQHVLVERYIPQALLLPRCAAVVAHAGAGTMLGALAHGVPLVLLPHGAEQFLNAAACARAGAGLVLDPGELAPAAVRAALERVLTEPSFAAAAAVLRDEIAEMPTADEAIAALTAG